MGCNNVKANKNATNSKVNNQPPAAAKSEINVVANFEGKPILEKKFCDDKLISSIFEEIKNTQTLKNYPSDSFNFYSNNTKINENISDLLKKVIIPQSNNILIEVNFRGLTDMPRVLNLPHSELIAKPYESPFELVIYDKNTKNFCLEFLSNDEKSLEIEEYSSHSAYCNGNNHLYISGGSNQKDLGHFWDIDIPTRKCVRSETGLKYPRRSHSMIWVPNSYVFIVGGNSVKEVEVYNIKTREFQNHSILNKERLEPALAIVNDSLLYAFTGFHTLKNEKIESFECINLRGEGKTWELINPIVDPLAGSFTQTFFACCNLLQDEIIFIGGMNTNKKNEKKFSFMYDHKNQKIKASDVIYEDIEFSDKNFYQLEKGGDFLILPNAQLQDFNMFSFTSEKKLFRVKPKFEVKTQ